MKQFDKQAFLDTLFSKRKIVNECWEWHNSLIYGRGAPFGYGITYYPPDKAPRLVHRISWSLANNRDIPPKKVIMHLCDNTRCYNPDHLKLGTYSENSFDTVNKGHHKRAANHGPRNK